MIWTDGSSNQWAKGAGVLLRTPEGDTVECAVRLQFSTTNNKTEYEVVLLGIDLAKVVEATSVVVHFDLQVVVGHINDDYEAKGERMKKYLSMVKSKTGDGILIKFIQIPREENEQVDSLAKATFMEHTDTINKLLSFIQYAPAIDRLEVQVIPLKTNWTTPIMSYLWNGTFLEDHNASRRLKV